jgi:hypothetical protein
MGFMERYGQFVTISLFEKANKHSILLDSHHVSGFYCAVGRFISGRARILF